MNENSRARWGLPDWARGEYPGPDNYSIRRWGWEFLRRRDDYRALWLACEHRAESTSNGVLVAIVDDVDAVRRQYGMTLVIDPRAQLSGWDMQLIGFAPFGYGVGYRSRLTVEADRKAHKLSIMFDLPRPLAPQIEAARDYLDRVQSDRFGAPASPNKNRIANWPLFLRVLDARECGATFAAITATLWPGSENKTAQSARDLHTAAQAVQQRAPFLL
jgi:hypothetical protein